MMSPRFTVAPGLTLNPLRVTVPGGDAEVVVERRSGCRSRRCSGEATGRRRSRSTGWPLSAEMSSPGGIRLAGERIGPAAKVAVSQPFAGQIDGVAAASACLPLDALADAASDGSPRRRSRCAAHRTCLRGTRSEVDRAPVRSAALRPPNRPRPRVLHDRGSLSIARPAPGSSAERAPELVDRPPSSDWIWVASSPVVSR